MAERGVELLIGARYCKLQGQTAAQLNLHNVDGELETLYVTESNTALRPLHNSDQYYAGLVIKSWH